MNKMIHLSDDCTLLEDDYIKAITSPTFNTIFSKINGYTQTWGATTKDDPEYCPYGPLIADIEVSTICSRGCKACYKANTKKGINMSLEDYQMVLGKLGPTVQQVALGIGDIDANKDLFDILHYTRSQGIIPNITINGNASFFELQRLSQECGAVAVSRYKPKVCYDTVDMLTRLSEEKNATLKQVNIHQILSAETLSDCSQLLEDMQTEKQLEKLNAVVFLLLKPKGRGRAMSPLRDLSEYKKLVDHALNNNLPIGFDSCGASSFVRAVKDRKNFNQLKTLAEPCESTRMSIYVSAEANVYPCSFCEGEEKPIRLEKVNNFLEEVWEGPQFRNFRDRLRNGCDENNCQTCPIYDLEMK